MTKRRISIWAILIIWHFIDKLDWTSCFFQNETKNWELPECGSFKNRIGFNFRTYSAVLLLKTAAQLRALKIISAKRESFEVKNRSIICHLKVELLFVINVISFRMITCHNITEHDCMLLHYQVIFKSLYSEDLVTKLTLSPTIKVGYT